MRDFDPKHKQGGDAHRSEHGDSPRGRFNREGADGRSADRDRDRTSSPFARDKRARTSKVKGFEKVSREPRTDRGDRPQEGERRSYNPNFTRDNRRTDGQRPSYGDRKPYRRDEREGGARPAYTKKEGYGRDGVQRGDRPYKPQAEGRPGYGSKPGSRRDDHGHRPDRPSGNKPGGKGGWKPRQDNRPKSYPKFDPEAIKGSIRLNRFIAQSGICSRREADDFIQAGVVTVNGQVVTELGTKITADDVVRFNDSIVRGEKKVYIVMNKPKGFVTTVDDPHADKTVIDLVKNQCEERVYPVGRLDKNSLGVLLITNDGDLTKQLTHPSYQKKKIYQVTLDKALTREDMQRLADGIELEDGPIFADEISYVGDSKKNVGVEIHSGRNRIVRRMFDALGYNVQKLDRVYFAGLTKKALRRGAWRFLTPREVEVLKSGRYE
ncbi:MAG: RNA-binding S4 domain-containing protein [Rikenellaceae bacterium]|nr:RNA-binding S4 domain-containing protein [Rikenellaceae bacterium]